MLGVNYLQEQHSTHDQQELVRKYPGSLTSWMPLRHLFHAGCQLFLIHLKLQDPTVMTGLVIHFLLVGFHPCLTFQCLFYVLLKFLFLSQGLLWETPEINQMVSSIISMISSVLQLKNRAKP